MRHRIHEPITTNREQHGFNPRKPCEAIIFVGPADEIRMWTLKAQNDAYKGRTYKNYEHNKKGV